VKDVLLLGTAALKRLMTRPFWFCQFLVSDALVFRVVNFGSMGNEHYNASALMGGFGDHSICSIDGSMSRANLRSWVRAILNVLPQVGASRERTKGVMCACRRSTVLEFRTWATSCNASS
jgi:hypothetical protein